MALFNRDGAVHLRGALGVLRGWGGLQGRNCATNHSRETHDRILVYSSAPATVARHRFVSGPVLKPEGLLLIANAICITIAIDFEVLYPHPAHPIAARNMAAECLRIFLVCHKSL